MYTEYSGEKEVSPSSFNLKEAKGGLLFYPCCLIEVSLESSMKYVLRIKFAYSNKRKS